MNKLFPPGKKGRIRKISMLNSFKIKMVRIRIRNEAMMNLFLISNMGLVLVMVLNINHLSTVAAGNHKNVKTINSQTKFTNNTKTQTTSQTTHVSNESSTTVAVTWTTLSLTSMPIRKVGKTTSKATTVLLPSSQTGIEWIHGISSMAHREIMIICVWIMSRRRVLKPSGLA